MAMTRQQFLALPFEHQQALNQFAGRLNLNVLTLNPEDAQPVKPKMPHHLEQMQIAAELKAAKRAANPIKHELPDESEVKGIAARLGLNPAHIRTKQQAEREAVQSELESLIASGDRVALITKFGDHQDPAIKQAAREAVGKLWPSFDSWRD